MNACAGNADMLLSDHYFMLFVLAAVLVVDLVALVFYLRHKP